VVGGQPPLLHGRGGQSRKANAIARRVDVFDRRLKMFVDLNPATRVRRQTRSRKVEQARVGLPPGGVKQTLRVQTFAALQPDLHLPPFTNLDLSDLFAQTKDGFLSPHVIAQSFHDLLIHEVEDGGPLVNDRHFEAERRRHRGVLEPDHAGPHDNQVARDLAAPPDLVGVNHLVAERYLGRAGRARAAGDEDIAGLHHLQPLSPFDLQRVRANEAGRAVEHTDAVSFELLSDDGHLSVDDRVHTLQQVGAADLLFEFVVASVEGALAVAGQVEHGLAERLAGDGADVQRHAARHLSAVNNRHAFAELGRGDGPFWPAGPLPMTTRSGSFLWTVG
jgi:hypothetical protein